MHDRIANPDLNARDLPPPEAEWWQITPFAMTCDRYDHWGSFDQCAEIGNHWAAVYTEEQSLPESLTELRTGLFFEQRRWHHFGEAPDRESMVYIRTLLEAIRRHVLAGGVE